MGDHGDKGEPDHAAQRYFTDTGEHSIQQIREYRERQDRNEQTGMRFRRFEVAVVTMLTLLVLVTIITLASTYRLTIEARERAIERELQSDIIVHEVMDLIRDTEVMRGHEHREMVTLLRDLVELLQEEQR